MGIMKKIEQRDRKISAEKYKKENVMEWTYIEKELLSIKRNQRTRKKEGYNYIVGQGVMKELCSGKQGCMGWRAS